MGRLKRDAVGLGATTVLLASGMAIAAPGTAAGSSPLVAGDCGTTVTGEEGQPISLDLESALGLSGAPTIAIGEAGSGTNTISVPGSQLLEHLTDLPLLGSVIEAAVPSVCEVTVEVVNTASAPVQDAAEPATEGLRETTESVRERVAPEAEPEPGSPPESGSGNTPEPEPQPESGGQESAGSTGGQESEPEPSMRTPNSDVHRPDSAPGGASTAGSLLPVEDFSSTPQDASAAPGESPAATASPGVRYGSEVPGYSPEFGLLGDEEEHGAQHDVASAGSADALPSGSGGKVEVPVVLAVLALSAAGGALVRTWALRRTLAVT